MSGDQDAKGEKQGQLARFINELRREGLECATIEYTERVGAVSISLKADVVVSPAQQAG